MRILIIGGTSFIGPHLVTQLQSAGHDVTVFHRGQTDNFHEGAAAKILGDRKNIDLSATALMGVAPNVVVDMIPHSSRMPRAFCLFSPGLASASSASAAATSTAVSPSAHETPKGQ